MSLFSMVIGSAPAREARPEPMVTAPPVVVLAEAPAVEAATEAPPVVEPTEAPAGAVATEAAPEGVATEAPAAVAAVATSGTARPKGWITDYGWSAPSRVKTLPRVSPLLAQKHATVFACCNVIAGDLSKVPLRVLQRGADGRDIRLREHPASWLLNVESSSGVPASLTRLAMIYAFTLRGVAYAYAPRDGGGELELIENIPQDGVSVLRNGRARFYDFEDGAQQRRRAPGRSMVHMRYMAADGWTGRSPIEIAAESVGLALAGQEAAARLASGMTMKAVIKMADTFEDDEAYRRNQRRVKDALTNPDVEGFPIIGEQDSITPLDLKAGDMELLARMRMDREQLASLWRVPPPKLGILEYGVKANAEQSAIDYLTDCLLHWGKHVEDQMGQSVLTEAERRAGIFLRHDFAALLRPATKERYEATGKAVGGPFMTPNEARQSEGLPPVPGGDVLNPAPNMTRPGAEKPDDNPKEGEE